jgi:predicted cobalt transporter CbtA
MISAAAVIGAITKAIAITMTSNLRKHVMTWNENMIAGLATFFYDRVNRLTLFLAPPVTGGSSAF